ncbi:MAG: DMT family transporter [Candidatus Omnitrophica bacterium]|nr:DMT family transporter [Candidatus Omnitrophota bacterium]
MLDKRKREDYSLKDSYGRKKLCSIFWIRGKHLLGYLFSNTAPLFTIILSYLLLKERASSLFFLGLVLVFLAIYLIMKREKLKNVVK